MSAIPIAIASLLILPAVFIFNLPKKFFRPILDQENEYYEMSIRDRYAPIEITPSKKYWSRPELEYDVYTDLIWDD